MDDARHGMKPGAAQFAGVLDRLIHRGGELLLPSGQRRHAPLSAGPVAGRQVEQHLLQLGVVERPPDLGGRPIIGEQVLDPMEAATGGGGEAVQEGMLLEHHRQIGGEFRHDSPRL